MKIPRRIEESVRRIDSRMKMEITWKRLCPMARQTAISKMLSRIFWANAVQVKKKQIMDAKKKMKMMKVDKMDRVWSVDWRTSSESESVCEASMIVYSRLFRARLSSKETCGWREILKNSWRGKAGKG